MKTSVFRAFLATAFAVGSMALLPQQAAAQINKGLPLVELTIGKAKLKAEVAADNNTRTVGLMNRFSLQPDHGMLFVFAQSQPLAFWMKNTYVPLDMVFFDAKGRILRIHEHAVPLSEAIIDSGVEVAGVLEILAGEARRRGMQVGDRLLHPRLGR